MVKKLLILLVLSVCLLAQDMPEQNIYEKKCVPCHKTLPTSLQQMFMKYLESYSGEKNVKTILKFYLKSPMSNLTVMSDLFIDSYGIKEPTKLNDKELDKAIEIYWEKFKVFDKLK